MDVRRGGRTLGTGRGWRGVVALACALVLVAAACRGGSSGSSSKGKKGAPGTTTGFDGKTITLGVISPQTGIASIIGLPLTNGGRVYFQALNAKGGVAGKYKVRLEVRDSQYNSNIAQQNYADLRDRVVMLEQLLGTDITNAVLTQMRPDKMVASPASLDAEWVRNPNLLPVAGPYQMQAINSISYWVNGGGGKGKRLCMIRSDDLYGKAGQNGVEFAAKHLDFKLGTIATFAPDQTDLTAQLQQVSSGCDAVFLVSLPTATLPLMGKAAAQNVDVRWIGLTPTYVYLLAQGATASYLSKHYWIAGQGPEWGDTSFPGMRQLLADTRRYAPDQKPDIYYAFGYVQAFTVTKLLEKAVALGDLSRDGIMKALDQLGTVDTMGLAGTYVYGPPAKRQPPKESTLFSLDPAAPGGLRALKSNFISDTAKQFQFPK